MTDLLDEDWESAPVRKTQAAAGGTGADVGRWETVLDFCVGVAGIVLVVPVLVALFKVCWRFWGDVALWCASLGQGALRSPGQAVPWLLAALFAVLACRRQNSQGG